MSTELGTDDGADNRELVHFVTQQTRFTGCFYTTIRQNTLVGC